MVNLQCTRIDRYVEMELTTTRNVGQAFTWGIMGNEALQAIQDLRWMIALCIILIIADYRFGAAESRKRHKEAKEDNNSTLAKMWEYRLSRAVRRTCNKFIDYMTLLLIFCILGLAVTEPYGICSHIITSGIAIIIAWGCEICSIFGHFCYLRGINIKAPKVTWKSVFVFLGRLLAGFAKTKDEDLGNALDDTITQTLTEENNKNADNKDAT